MTIATIATTGRGGGYQEGATQALQWIAYASRVPVDVVADLGLDYEQLVTLGSWLAANPLINPPATRKLKRDVFVCQCGCGETFVATWRTAKPKYKNAAHKQRAYRARQQHKVGRKRTVVAL